MDNLGKGIQSLIPKKSVVSQPPIEKGDDIDNSDEALEKQISQKIDKLIAPLSELNQDLKKEIKPQESEFHDDLNFKPRVKGDKKMDKIFYLEADKIKSNPEQPRHHFSESSIDELADSIRGYGILEPLIVYRHELESSTGTQVEYYLIAGERRLLAAKKLGLETVPAIIRETDSEKEKLELADSIKAIGILLSPFMPKTSEKISQVFNFDIKIENLDKPIEITKIRKADPLFNKVG